MSPLCCNQSRAQHGPGRTLAASLQRHSSGSCKRASCSSPLVTPFLGPSQTHNLWLITRIHFFISAWLFLVKCTHYCASQKFMRICSVLSWHHAWSWKWEERSWDLSSILPLARSMDPSTAYTFIRDTVYLRRK